LGSSDAAAEWEFLSPNETKDASFARGEAIVGTVRIQALSPRLLRVEPKGPMGFEDRSTFMVVNRDFDGVPIKRKEVRGDGTLLETEHYSVLLRVGGINPLETCDAPAESTGVAGGVQTVRYNNQRGTHVSKREDCCTVCEEDPTCMAWVFNLGNISGLNCWPLISFKSRVSSPGSELGFATRARYARPNFAVLSPDSSTIYDSTLDPNPAPHLLHWPSPLESTSYALVDRPRFFVPEWGPTPIPEGVQVDPVLRQTNGYDFRNGVDGDTYVFLMGAGPLQDGDGALDGWEAARGEFLKLAGPCPLLPDFAFGTWFTFWHPYTEASAKADLARWRHERLPLDVWGLDMNWRLATNLDDYFYDRPNKSRFANFPEWFAYLRGEGLRTYFNDHPFPVASRRAGGLQTSSEEVAFRWEGLSRWLKQGLTFWWFDANWHISIPPPFVNSSKSFRSWRGLDNVAWGSHVYYKSVETFDKKVRDKTGDNWYGGRPITLTKSSRKDWWNGLDAHGQAENPAHHRFPVWWTGDWMDLRGSVETMVDAGVHGFKPYVHSDCGGDHRYSGADLVRWVAHCAFGTILRIHGADHRPWTYEERVLVSIRGYLATRYRLLPALVAAGQRATRTGHPLVARGDLYWPELAPASASNEQYIFLEDLLVAPLDTFCKERSGEVCAKDLAAYNYSSRDVWIPPGAWEDVWYGSVVTGPAFITVERPYDRQPMWYRRDGGLVVVCDDDALRVQGQDWSTLVLEVFPSARSRTTRRSVFERDSAVRTDLVLSTDSNGLVRLQIDAGKMPRSWVLRVHLLPDQHIASATLDGEVATAKLVHLEPRKSDDDGDGADGFFPFGGAGSAPASKAGPIVELHVLAAVSAEAHMIEMRTLQGPQSSPGLGIGMKFLVGQGLLVSPDGRLCAPAAFAALLALLPVFIVTRRWRQHALASPPSSHERRPLL